MKPSVTFWAGVGTVTGSNFELSGDNFRVLVDCGIVQGVPQSEELNAQQFPYNPASIDALFITHAHMDHIGRVPELVKAGFTGTIYSTEPTKALAELMLADNARIAASNAEEKGMQPPYGPTDMTKTFSLWKTLPYRSETKIKENLFVTLRDSGHILGSAMYLFRATSDGIEKTILFTGDLGNSPSLLLPDTEYVTDADAIVMDSVYGDRNHEPKEEREAKFKATVEATIARKGTLLIPSFSMERTQTMLYELNSLIEGKQIPSVPVFLDSPLAISVTEVYERLKTFFNAKVTTEFAAGDDVFNFPKLRDTANVRDSREIAEVPAPKIIIAGSGMSSGGRILYHEALYLPDANNTLMLIGYQAAGTLGRQLQEGAKEVMIHEQKVAVNAEVVTIDGYSGHKDSDHLVDFAEHALLRTKTFFIVLGEPKSTAFLSQKMRDNLSAHTVIPERGKAYPIS